MLYVDAYGEALRAARSLFLSRKVAQTYAGYADDQLKRMETHYRWLHNPPDHQPAPGGYVDPVAGWFLLTQKGAPP